MDGTAGDQVPCQPETHDGEAVGGCHSGVVAQARRRVCARYHGLLTSHRLGARERYHKLLNAALPGLRLMKRHVTAGLVAVASVAVSGLGRRDGG